MPETPKTRERSLPGLVVDQKSIRLAFSTFPDLPTKTRKVIPGRQMTVSEGHQWPPPKGEKLTDRGGAFYTTKCEILVPKIPSYLEITKYVSGPSSTRFSGHIVAWPHSVVGDQTLTIMGIFPPDLASTDASLDQKGATAIARSEPTNSVADLSTALTELMREGLPSIIGSQSWKNRSSSARKNAAGEYLNVQFGIQPLISEISKVAEAISKSDKLLDQYERDAGRVVRRKYYFPSETSEVTTKSGLADYYAPCMGAGEHPILRSFGVGQLYRTRKTVREAWFSGAFTYHLPSDYDSRNKLKRLSAQADFLLGTKLSAETLWNIAPWSWAIDWFSNTGDVVHNIEAFKTNGLIMRYGYVMETTTTTDTYTWVWNSGTVPVPPKVSPLVVRRITKKRRPANPFGFGVSWSGLSPFQVSIAAALGLSRGR